MTNPPNLALLSTEGCRSSDGYTQSATPIASLS